MAGGDRVYKSQVRHEISIGQDFLPQKSSSLYCLILLQSAYPQITMVLGASMMSLTLVALCGFRTPFCSPVPNVKSDQPATWFVYHFLLRLSGPLGAFTFSLEQSSGAKL